MLQVKVEFGAGACLLTALLCFSQVGPGAALIAAGLALACWVFVAGHEEPPQ